MDAVRFLGNRSTGRLALELARAAVEGGHAVVAFLAEAVLLPADLEGRLVVRRFETSRDLLSRLVAADEPAPDLVLHCAAVADYAPEPVAGKVPSGQDEWVLRLWPLPKVADAVRARFPEALLLLFKLETGVEAGELEQRARTAAARAGAGWVFANLLEEAGAGHAGLLLEVGGEFRERLAGSKAEVARRIVAVLEQARRKGARGDGGE